MRCRDRKLVIELLPGPTGPIGPAGPDTVAPITRALKVQLIDGELIPIIIEGFSWVEDVAAPVGWPLPGTYTFYKATVLDKPQFNLSELLNVSGTITHTDVMIQQQAAVAHYRGSMLQDIHWASSLIPNADSIDTLATQTLHDVIIGDCMYFAITPNVSAVTGFNYNVSNVRCVPTFMIPDDLPINLPRPSAGLLNGPYKALVTASTSITFELTSGGGGGGSGGTSTSNDTSIIIAGGGGGGGSGGAFVTAGTMSLALASGDVLDWQIGGCGTGGVGVAADGKDGGESCIKLNGTLLSGATFAGPNPIPGGKGGKAGDLTVGGDGGMSSAGDGGGGGGAPLANLTPGTPGMGVDGGDDGGTDPRDGGAGGGGANEGGIGGTTMGVKGSGGGGGGSFIVGGGGRGGDGGIQGGSFGSPGQNALLVNGGGGGGSGGVPNETNSAVPGGRGGIGGSGTIKIEMA